MNIPSYPKIGSSPVIASTQMDEYQTPFCVWQEKEEGAYWETQCGHAFTFIAGDPDDNGMIYCAYCGRRLNQIVITREDERRVNEDEDAENEEQNRN